MKSYSLDFRQKIVELYDKGGISQQMLAERFCVSVFFVKKLFRQRRLHGNIAPLARNGWQKGLLSPEIQDYFTKICKDNNKLKLKEIADQIETEFGIHLSNSTICRAMKILNPRPKSKKRKV